MSGKIYTKTGDKGMTSNYDGTREMKSCVLYDVIGDIDLLNSSLGNESFGEFEDDKTRIQIDLFDMGAYFSSAGEIKFEKDTVFLEKRIDSMTESIPVLKNFILPRHPLHITRGYCRKAERKTIKFFCKEEYLYLTNDYILAYLNRLSDYLFTLARYLSQTDCIEEILYIKSKN